MIGKSLMLAALVAAGPAFAQTAPPSPPPAGASTPVPECRDLPTTTPAGTQCQFGGTTLPIEQYLGTISLPSNDHTPIFGVPGTGISTPVHKPLTFDVTALATMQSESFDYSRYVSQGFKIDVGKEWNDWLSLDLRGTIVRFNWASIGGDPGNNHTESVTVGPRLQHQMGIFRPYIGGQLGVGYQYRWYMSLGPVAGVDVKLTKRLRWVIADAEYHRAFFQSDGPIPGFSQRDRVELSTGFTYHFGS